MDPERSGSASSWPFVCAGLVLVVLAALANEWVLGAWLTAGGHVTNPASRLLLFVCDVFLLAAGVTLVVRQRRAPWKQMLLAVTATVMALGAAEVGLRGWFGVRAWLRPADRVLSATIGWRPAANVSLDTEVPGFGRVRYSTGRGGFRVFGDPQSSKPKVLVLGDSFTEAATVSDGEAYYQYLARARPDLEFFAIGGGGYGTLQEYMLLDEWVDLIRPDLILLQLHPNDLINNSHDLESRSTTNNNQMLRPYWEQGRVVQRFPENVGWGPIYNLARHSYLMRLLNVNLTVLRSDATRSIEQTLRPDDSMVVAALATTVELLSKIRTRAGVSVVAFSVKPERFFAFWSRAEACHQAGVQFIPGVGEAVDAAADAGEHVTGMPIDSHWNARGNEIAAGVIAEWLRAHGLPARAQ